MSHLECSVDDGVATLTMNRPEARNALSAEIKDGFAAHLPRLYADPDVRALVLHGAGGAFCAGGDLRGMQQARGQLGVEGMRQRMLDVQPWLKLLIDGDKPVLAAVDGPAFGAGFSLALMADFVVASPRARFCMSFMRVGLVPDFAAMYHLPRVVGVQRAKELMMTAREVDAGEALRLGLALEVVPAEEVLARTQALARSFVGASAMALGLVRRGVGMSLAEDAAALLAREADQQALCYQTEAHQAAVRRFLDKQPAAFRWPAPSA